MPIPIFKKVFDWCIPVGSLFIVLEAIRLCIEGLMHGANKDSAEFYQTSNEENLATMEEGCAKILTLEGEMPEQFMQGAYDAAWAEVEEADPQAAAEMRAFTSN